MTMETTKMLVTGGVGLIDIYLVQELHKIDLDILTVGD